MANRNFVGTQALLKNLKLVSGSFQHDGVEKLGQGYSVARTAVGKYTITLDDAYPSLASSEISLQLATGDDKHLQFGAIDVASAKTIDFSIQDKSSANAYEVTDITTIADTGAYEVTEITFPATVGAAQGDYVSFENVAGQKSAIWLDIDANGTAPTGAVYVAATNKIKVPIVTGGTAAQNATLAKVAIGTTIPNVTIVDNLAGKLTITQNKIGLAVDSAPHNTGDTGVGSITVSVATQGAASNLQNTYFTINSADDLIEYYVWMNVGAEGVDPAIAGKTGVEIAIAAGAADTASATAIQLALHALSAFNATVLGATATVTNAAYGVTTDAADGTAATGFTIAVTTQGDSMAKDIVADANNRINFQLWLNNGTID